MATEVPSSEKALTPEQAREIQKKRNEKVNEGKPVPMRRVRFLIINPTDFLMIFTKGMVIAKRTQILEGVPEDAKLVNMTIDHVRGGIILVVQSDSYDEIPMTDMPPVQHIEIKLGVDGATKKKRKK